MTESFYPAAELKPLFNRNKYILDYETVRSRFRYRLKITGFHYSQLQLRVNFPFTFSMDGSQSTAC